MEKNPEELNQRQQDASSPIQPVGPISGAEIYQRLVKEVRDYAIFMLDQQGFIRTWNVGAERLKGYTPEEIVGRHFSCFYPEADIRNKKPDKELEIALAEGRLEDEGWRIKKDGSRFWANVIITAIFDENHKHIGFGKVTRDLTERRMAEEALRAERADLEKRVEERTAALAKANLDLANANKAMARANGELERASRMKDQFLAVLSHELRTPLTSIYGWLSMLRAGKVEQPDMMKALQVIERNVRAQTQLVDDLLNVSRVVTGNLKIAPQWIDPVSVVNAAVDSILPAAMAKNINISVEAADSERIYADPDRLQQVVWNLLTNAVKFTGKGGEVKVEVARVASKIQISVSDTGQGIAPEFLPYVFDRFSQADASTTRKTGGLGLGLSIVRHIVELHGGAVIAHSEGLGRGTTIIIQIPIPAIRRREDSEPPEAHATSLEGLKVMIVEDEDDTREMLEQALQSYGASVLVAASAAEALQQIAGKEPDVLISDIGLPNMDGYELLLKIRSEMPEKLRNIPAVALTAFATAEHKEKSKLAGYQAHISKPVAVPDLISVLARVAKNKL
jgi:PAS domain S-box-containing protein